MSQSSGQDPRAMINSLMCMNTGEAADEPKKLYRDTEDDRMLMNEHCQHVLGHLNGKYKSQKGIWNGETYSKVMARLSKFPKQHVRRAYHEQLQLVIQGIFAPAQDALWAGIDKGALVNTVAEAWTQYITVCDHLPERLSNLELTRGSVIRNGINLYADPESDFRVSAIAIFRNRLLEIEPLLMGACGHVVLLALNGEDMSNHYAALRSLVTCYISMHDCSGHYLVTKRRWFTDRKNTESIASLQYGVMPKSEEKELYCSSGGIEDTLLRVASAWFFSKVQSNFADTPLIMAVDRLKQLFSSELFAHPGTLPKLMSSVVELLKAQGRTKEAEEIQNF